MVDERGGCVARFPPGLPYPPSDLDILSEMGSSPAGDFRPIEGKPAGLGECCLDDRDVAALEERRRTRDPDVSGPRIPGSRLREGSSLDEIHAVRRGPIERL